MVSRPNRWGDEDHDEPEDRSRRDRSGSSSLTVVLLVLGSLFVLGVFACGVTMWFGFRTVQRKQEAMVRADMAQQEAERERLAALQAAANPGLDEDGIPSPKPTAGPVTPPSPLPPTNFETDKAGDQRRWQILFRSKNPALWNTDTQTAADFAQPLRSTPPNTRYLRLRRMDTGEAIIISMTRGRIAGVDHQGQGPTVRWNGSGKDEHGGYHLGIAEGQAVKWLKGDGVIAILMDGWDANQGSGFGHAHNVKNSGQRFAWLGKEIKPTAFEVAVTTADLTEAERKWLKE
jgi:hypothetical protein